MDRFFNTLESQRHKLLRHKNVIGVGVGLKYTREVCTDKLAIIVFVQKKLPETQIYRSDLIPKKINDLETDVVEIGTVRLIGRTDRLRPAQPGLSIGHFKTTAGTFGAVVKDKKTGEKLILSNNHVLANATNGKDGRAKIGDPILQPGPYDGGTMSDKIGTLYRYIPMIKTEEQTQCPVAQNMARTINHFLHIFKPNYNMRFYKRDNTSNIVDCALCKPDRSNLISPEIYEIGELTGIEQVTPGMSIQKSGRTSGLTKGKVNAIGVTIQVEVSEKETGWFQDQVVGDIISRPGDSGSLIVNENNKAVGLLFAASDKFTIFNRIENVLNKLDVELIF
ncbi:hypothetical protein [Desulfolucanica intricata]|uniref:hypothetical protein n=1 Tax=Desulfolucanica intricata TaxID=1285191 RepID=UPI000834AB69|nr:hypothetical protein [Desulfolucanica intricata]